MYLFAYHSDSKDHSTEVAAFSHNKYRTQYWVELASHGPWTLMNPQILRRVEDPCQTEHMRRGIQYFFWEAFRYHSFEKGPFSPTATERKDGERPGKPPQPRRRNMFRFPARIYCLYREEMHVAEAHDAVPHLPLKVIVAHVLGRSCHPRTTALCMSVSPGTR
jgi:hypothetical protein